MAVFLRNKTRLQKSLFTLQRFSYGHTLAERASLSSTWGIFDCDSTQNLIDVSNWKKIRARGVGVTRSMIPPSPWTVLKILHDHGFEAYLVGGCVRDLLLNKIPKDFDVITTAKLQRVKEQFRRCEIIGRRFPICKVFIKGSAVEVSSFETLAEHSEEKEKFLLSQMMPSCCDEEDIIRWRNSMHRDFTINSLFFDPFKDAIYDYANGTADLRSLKLRTLISAHLSFKEDCARILRGLRIAGRLGLSIAKDTEGAMHKLSSSLKGLDKGRIMMEMNYMLSYGAAEATICLLQRFNILELFLPFHAAYLNQQAAERSDSPVMLRKLFFNLDKMLGCDRPCDYILWVGLLAFHQALVSHPQDALVIWVFASVLYHGSWKEGVKCARESANLKVRFAPEMSGFSEFKSDEELAKEVCHLASLIQFSIGALVDGDTLAQSMRQFPAFPHSGLVFVSPNAGNRVAQLFDQLVDDVESFERGRPSFMINYPFLRQGKICETLFVLGKVILGTLSGEEQTSAMNEIEAWKSDLNLSDMVRSQVEARMDREQILQQSDSAKQIHKKQKLVKIEGSTSGQEVAIKKEDMVFRNESREAGKKEDRVSRNKSKELGKRSLNIVDISQLSEEEASVIERVILGKKKHRLQRKEVSSEKAESFQGLEFLEKDGDGKKKIKREDRKGHCHRHVLLSKVFDDKDVKDKEKSAQPLLSKLFR